MVLHPHAVAEEGTARVRRGGIHGEDGRTEIGGAGDPDELPASVDLPTPGAPVRPIVAARPVSG